MWNSLILIYEEIIKYVTFKGDINKRHFKMSENHLFYLIYYYLLIFINFMVFPCLNLF